MVSLKQRGNKDIVIQNLFGNTIDPMGSVGRNPDKGPGFDVEISQAGNPHFPFSGKEENNIFLGFVDVFGDILPYGDFDQEAGYIGAIRFLAEERLDLNGQKGMGFPG